MIDFKKVHVDCKLTLTDLGSGSGRLALSAAILGFTKVQGFDLNPTQVENAASRWERVEKCKCLFGWALCIPKQTRDRCYVFIKWFFHSVTDFRRCGLLCRTISVLISNSALDVWLTFLYYLVRRRFAKSEVLLHRNLYFGLIKRRVFRINCILLAKFSQSRKAKVLILVQPFGEELDYRNEKLQLDRPKKFL